MIYIFGNENKSIIFLNHLPSDSKIFCKHNLFKFSGNKYYPFIKDLMEYKNPS